MIAEIDESTGLPKLPEGYFWRVGESALSIMWRKPVGVWSEWKPVTSTAAFLSTSYEVENRTREEARRWPRKTVMVPEYRTRLSGDDVPVFVTRYGEWEPAYRGWQCVEADPVTVENLHDRALETFTGWDAKKASDALLGDYPPKKFGGAS